jgi:hypothetical protein
MTSGLPVPGLSVFNGREFCTPNIASTGRRTPMAVASILPHHAAGASTSARQFFPAVGGGKVSACALWLAITSSTISA